MKTFLDSPIKESTRGILYLCKYCHVSKTILVAREIQFDNPGDALNAYANIPNPESQIAMGRTELQFLDSLTTVHDNLNNPEWVKELANYL